jgi:hypothetical protein
MRKRIDRDIDILIGCKMSVAVQPVEKMHPLACDAGRGKSAPAAKNLHSYLLLLGRGEMLEARS